MKINFLKHKKKNFLKSKKIIWIILILVVLIITVMFFTKKAEQEIEITHTLKEVKIASIEDMQGETNEINISGVVKADGKVDVFAMSGGRVEEVNFELGKNVSKGQLLVSVYDSSILTGFQSAQSNYYGLQQNLYSTSLLTEQSVHQAEVSLQSAKESVRLAEIALQSAQDTYNNAEQIQIKTKKDTKDSALITYTDGLAVSLNALNQVDYVLGLENKGQIAGISETLGILNRDSLREAEKKYYLAKEKYDQVVTFDAGLKNIEESLNLLIELLQKVADSVSQIVVVLGNTTANENFVQTSFDAQKNSFNSLRTSTNQTLSSTQKVFQNLKNIDLRNKQELDSLMATVVSAQKQLDLARLTLNNAEAGVNVAKQAKEQQLVGAQTNLNNASSQLASANKLASDLKITAPIKGVITAKMVQTGQEVVPGQKVAEISEDNLVKILIELSSEDVYKVKLGNQVFVNENLLAVISNISPTADPVTRKVEVEIAFDNTDKQLIVETFVDVNIPLNSSVNKIWLPLSAVKMTQTGNFIFVEENGKVKKTEVIVGEPEGDKIEITSNLPEGIKIIIESDDLLQEGDEVEILN